MAVFNIVTQGANWVIGSNVDGKKTGLPSVVSSLKSFSDNITFTGCSQFAGEALDFLTIGECNASAQSTISKFVKNSTLGRYINKFSSAVDVAKKTVSTTIDATKQKFGQTYYCNVMAPMFNILINLLEALLTYPKKILALLYKYLEKILELIKSLINNLFTCFEALASKFKDILNNLTASEFLNLMQGVTVWSVRCEVIAGPIVSLFNTIFNDSTVKQMLYDIGTITSPTATIKFYSIQEVNAFLKVAFNLTAGLTKVKERVLNRIYNSSEYNSMIHGYKLTKAYVQFCTAIVMKTILSPLLRLGAFYNNLLHTRSRFLGIIVNYTIGWLFPPKGTAHPYEDNKIYRTRYSISDVLIICDSLNDCNDYLCGGIKNKVQEIFNELKINGNCWWINPLIKANSYLEKVVQGLQSAYDNAFTATETVTNTLSKYIDLDWIKAVRDYNTNFFAVEGYA